MRTLLIEGGSHLKGTYPIQGNKNAALPVLAATLLARRAVCLLNVPRIWDVESMLSLLRSLGASADWQGDALWIDPSRFQCAALPPERVEQLRGAILLTAPLAARADSMESGFPGGCPIGARTFERHWEVFRAAGFQVEDDRRRFRIQRQTRILHPEVYLGEASVTATENALILFSALDGGTIYNAAREPHVRALGEFLMLLGAQIEHHPTALKIRRGVAPPDREITFEIQPDFVDAGTLAIAAGVTGGQVTLTKVCRQDLIGIEHTLKQYGVQWDWQDEGCVNIKASEITNPSRVVIGLWPSFPTDLSSLAIVLSTQGSGSTLVHDWMYESRMFFVDKLVRMGARIILCDPHRVVVQGPTALRATTLESPDIRAGMALIVAGLVARGQTRIEHAEVVFRGYERIVERLGVLGASIREQ
ncbi:MAG: UDP-N-acetylglucosamine 1-carboxyvinyltransferase [Acidobacteria bacterium]|nr:UDP-N-acetylglucosamine 1-carboxyvinyltransferase [Acidobacteriota bacterium]